MTASLRAKFWGSIRVAFDLGRGGLPAMLAPLVLCAGMSHAGPSAAAPAPTSPAAPASTAPDIIPFSELGTRAAAADQSGAIRLTKSDDGAILSTRFQKLSGHVTAQGLQLRSMESAGGALHLRADVISRAAGLSGHAPQTLPTTGGVSLDSDRQQVRWSRPGVVEEYSVSADGLRQDFILSSAPAGQGDLRVELALSGARAAAATGAGQGVRLTLEGSGRELVYSRLHVVDAHGRPLVAHMSVLSPTRLAVQVRDAGAAYPLRIDPTFTDADWVSLSSGMCGVDGNVTAMAMDEKGYLYIGGDFTHAGSVTAHHIARWDGNLWAPLGAGLSGSDATVSAIVISGGTLYVGGRFEMAGQVEALNIARWNGTEWSAMGLGLDNQVLTLLMQSGSLYAGGQFSFSGEQEIGGLAKWNGGEWSSVGTGVQGVVSSLAASGSTLYAGGFFETAGGVIVNNIAQWNGRAWSALSTGTEAYITSLAVRGKDLFVGGEFSEAGGLLVNYIARWDGSAWSAVGDGVNGPVLAMAVSGQDLYAVGMFTLTGEEPVNAIAKWNGLNWSAVGTGVEGGGASALLIHGQEIYVGGLFDSAGGQIARSIARWNGTSWSALGIGIDVYVYSVAVSGSDLYAGGLFTSIGQTRAHHIARWDGSQWFPLGPGLDGNVTALAVMDGKLYAGGNFLMAGDQIVNSIACWDGSTWSTLGEGIIGSVNALAVMEGQLYAGGAFQEAGGISASNIARWTGTGWFRLAGGMNSTGHVHALAVSGTDLYAGGTFTTAGGITAIRVARWTGSAWVALGTGINGPVLSLAVDGASLYAGGRFTAAGGVAASCVARWNGTTWAALGTGMSGTFTDVNALLVHEGYLYAGGYFERAGGIAAPGIAQWTGSAWSAFGSGLHSVLAMVAGPGDRLYIGGGFMGAGEVHSPYIIQANLRGTPDIMVYADDYLPPGTGRVSMGSTLLTDSTVTRSLSITNQGTATLHLTGTPRVTLRGSPAFTITTQPSATIAPDADAGLQIAFDPATAGLHQATLTVASDDPDTPVYTLALQGIGLAAQLSQTITFTTPATMYESETSQRLIAQSSSGLPVQFSLISGPALASYLQDGDVVQTGPGTIKVQASQPGGGLYKAATPVVKTIVVKPDPTGSFAITGLLQAYDGTEKTAQIVGDGNVDQILYKVGGIESAYGPKDAGSYSVKAVAGTTVKTATLVIVKAPALLIPHDQHRATGQPNPPLTYSVFSHDSYRDPLDITFIKPPVLSTKATPTSPGGLYPITASGATSLNYSFTYLPAHLAVTTFAGTYESMLTDDQGMITGKLSVTIPASSTTFSAKLTTSVDAATATVSFASGSLESSAGGTQITGSARALVTSGSAKVPWSLTLHLPHHGPMTALVSRDGTRIGRATDGSKLLTLPSGQSVTYAGAHTLVMEPAQPAHIFVPAGSGWATATISKTGGITYAGKLADGTSFTTTTLPDEAADPRHRLFVHPYKAPRPQAWLAGSFSLAPHPVLAGRRHVAEGALIWRKDVRLTDPLYRGRFGPVSTAILLDPWQSPRTKAPAVTLAQRLGLTVGSSFGITHQDTASASRPHLPTRLTLSTTGAAVSVLTPLANLTQWKTKTFSPVNGTFTGSFELTDTDPQGFTLKRTVLFSGILRQPAESADPLIGAGHYILPSSDPFPHPDSTWSRDIMLTRP